MRSAIGARDAAALNVEELFFIQRADVRRVRGGDVMRRNGEHRSGIEIGVAREDQAVVAHRRDAARRVRRKAQRAGEASAAAIGRGAANGRARLRARSVVIDVDDRSRRARSRARRRTRSSRPSPAHRQVGAAHAAHERAAEIGDMPADARAGAHNALDGA